MYMNLHYLLVAIIQTTAAINYSATKPPHNDRYRISSAVNKNLKLTLSEMKTIASTLACYINIIHNSVQTQYLSTFNMHQRD